MSTTTMHTTTLRAATTPNHESDDTEPDDQWKAELKQRIDESLKPKVKSATKSLVQGLRRPGISDEDFYRFKSDYTQIMRDVRKISTESYHTELDRERSERRWAAGVPISSGWNQALNQEQMETLEMIKRENEGGTSASSTSSPIEKRRRASTSSRATAERVAPGIVDRSPLGRLSSTIPRSFSEDDVGRQSRRYTTPHNSRSLSSSHPLEAYSAPSSSALRSRRESVTDDEYSRQPLPTSHYGRPREFQVAGFPTEERRRTLTVSKAATAERAAQGTEDRRPPGRLSSKLPRSFSEDDVGPQSKRYVTPLQSRSLSSIHPLERYTILPSALESSREPMSDDIHPRQPFPASHYDRPRESRAAGSPIEKLRRTSMSSTATAERAVQRTKDRQAPTAQDIKCSAALKVGTSASSSSSPITERSSPASRAAAEWVALTAQHRVQEPYMLDRWQSGTYNRTKAQHTRDDDVQHIGEEDEVKTGAMQLNSEIRPVRQSVTRPWDPRPPVHPVNSFESVSSSPRGESEFMVNFGQSIRRSSGGRPPVPRVWALPPPVEHNSEVELDIDTEDELMVRRVLRPRLSMEMESIRETEVRLTEFPSRSGSISERNSAQSSPKHMHALWKPSVEKDASAYRSPVNRVHRNNAASLQFNGSTSSRPSIFEMISDPSRFSRKKERKNDADEAQSPHDNEYDYEKQVSPKMAREGVRYTEDDVAKSPGSHYPYQGTSSPRRVASKASLSSDSSCPTGEHRVPPKPVHVDSLDDELPPQPLPKIYYKRPPESQAAGSHPYVRTLSGAVHEERAYQPGATESPRRRLSSTPSFSSDDVDRQSGRYAVPHNASPLSASHLPGGYPIPSSASRSCGLDHVLHGECDDSCTHGHHLSPEEIPDYTYGDSRPVISRRSSYMREEERRRNDDDGSFRRLSSSSSSNPMSMPRRSPNVVVNEPVMGSWKVRTNSRRPSEPHHVHPRIYQNHFHPLGWDLSSYVGDHTDSPALRAFGGGKSPPGVDSDVEDYDFDEVNLLEEKEEEMLFIEDPLKRKKAEARMKELEAKKRAIDAWRNQLEMPKSKTEAVLKEDHARTKAAEIQLREQQSKVRVEEAKKWAEDTRQEEKVEQQEEARRKGGEIDRPNKESVKEEQRNVEDNEHDWDEDIDDEINVAVAARWSELRRELDRQGLSSGQKQGVNEALLKEIFPDACTVFKTVFSDKTEYKNLLRLEQRTVQSLLDVMQTILDYAIVNVSDSKFERYLLKAMLRLSKQSALYPSSYILTGIKRDAYPIASGYFGEIFKGEINGRKLALKVFKLYANEMDKINDLLKAFYKEAILWRHLVHPNLLPFYGIYQLGDTGGRICLVSPWMSNGNIYQCLQRYPNTNRQHLIMDIARGIAYLHGKSIVHGDLKGANVLISDNGVACLADFGLSSVCIDTPSLAWGTKDSSVSRSTGTLRWQAPELISLEDSPTVKMTTKSDIYAFACVCYEVFVGKMPFYQFQHDVTVITKVISGQRPLPPKPDSKAYQSGLTDWMWSLIEECWDQNPTKRPMISDVVDRLSSREEFLRHGDKDHESWGDLRPEIFRSLLAEDESPVSEADIRNSLSLLHSLNEM